MVAKKSKSSPFKTAFRNDPEPIRGSRKLKVQTFASYAPSDDHVRFDEMDGQTIYIVKLEPQASDQFGSGYKVWFKDMPNASETRSASVFGQFVVPVLEGVYKNTHEGKLISLDSPLKTTIRKAGRSYRFE